MDYITTTELRTKSSQLVQTLKNGGNVRLIHRSKVVGNILPIQEPKPFDAERFSAIIKDLKPAKLIPRKDRDKVYRKHLMEKYGKNIS